LGEVVGGSGGQNIRGLTMKNCKKLLVFSFVVAIVVSFAPVLWAEEAEEPQPAQPAQEEQMAEKVNINTATAEELAQLKNVGSAYAARIVEYRQEHGLFEKPEDIMKVKGIGEKTFELNKDRITVE
jgi:comEA protein